MGSCSRCSHTAVPFNTTAHWYAAKPVNTRSPLVYSEASTSLAATGPVARSCSRHDLGRAMLALWRGALTRLQFGLSNGILVAYDNYHGVVLHAVVDALPNTTLRLPGFVARATRNARCGVVHCFVRLA